jgi:hypothetical protein
MTKFLPKLKVFYKFSLLSQTIINKNNTLLSVFTGPLFGDKKIH